MVFLGRPVLWGLFHSGQAGVEKVLTILQEEFFNVARLMGTKNMADVHDPSLLIPTTSTGAVVKLSSL